MIRLTFALVLFFNYAYAQTSLNEIALKNGKYGVGFKHYVVNDSSRTYTRSGDWNGKALSRPISISLWYPGQINPLTRMVSMSVLDYLRILKEEEEWEHLPDEQILNWFYYSNSFENQKHLTERSTAYRNLAPIGMNFPIIVYSASYQASSIENFLLCEYLASHGYIVIAAPSQGAFTKPLEGGTVRDLETQARDAEFLLSQALNIKQADKDKIALMGFSFGGMSNTLVKMRNSMVKAVVSLDGSERYQYATLSKSPYFNPNRMDVPYIHLSQKEIPKDIMEEQKLDPKLNTEFLLFDSLKNSKAYKFKLHNMTHAYFSTLGVLFNDRDKRQDKSDQEIMASYRLVSAYTLHFLNSYLKDDSKSIAYLSRQSELNTSESALISKEFKDPVKQQFRFEDFNNSARLQQYNRLDEIYNQIVKEHANFKLSEGNLNNLGLHLLFDKETSQDGIKVFLFATKLYPQSANLFDSLAEAYLHVGDKPSAVANFKKSLSLDRSNQNAINRLKELE
jgi:dienelactone hydrolase